MAETHQLPTDEWAAVERIVGRFEAAWQRGSRPRIDDYLGDPSVNRSTLLLELARVDLERRLDAGDAARAEDYLRRYADLSDDRTAALELIAAEFQLRRQREESVTQEEYLKRFPAFSQQLREILNDSLLGQPRVGRRPGSTGQSALDSTIKQKADDWQGRSSRESGNRSTQSEGLGSLGRFQLWEVLGQGAFGTVYRGYDPKLEREVAVKVPRTGALVDAEDVARFLREAKAAAQLRHSNIVPVYDAGVCDGTYFIASAMIAGRTLRQ